MKTKRRNFNWLAALSLLAGCGGNEVGQLATEINAPPGQTHASLHHTEAKELIAQNCDQGKIVSLNPGDDHHHEESGFFFKHLPSSDKIADFVMHTCPVPQIGKVKIKLPDGSHVTASNPGHEKFHHPIAIDLDEHKEEHSLICSVHKMSSRQLWPILFHPDGRVIKLDYAGLDELGKPCWQLKGKEYVSQPGTELARLKRRAINGFLEAFGTGAVKGIVTVGTLGLACIAKDFCDPTKPL